MIGLSARLMAKTPAQGADTAAWLASSPEVEGVSGKFFEERKERACEFRDPGPIARLVDLCNRQTSTKAAAA